MEQLAESSSNIHIQYSKLLTIDDDNKIISHFDKNISNTNKCVIVSMIGCARVGKSTFINAFISSILKTNVDIIKTSSSSEHCTIGIDYIHVSCKNESDNIRNHNEEFSEIIILDCQGLSYGDSKNDDKLLSVIYMLSDVIIFHEPGILNNQTLNTLTSLCLVVDYIKTEEIKDENKPILFFRMRDYNLECDPNEILSRTFDTQADQYDKVRGAIKKLFPVIQTIHTEPLGKKEQLLLKNKNFLAILENDDYGFEKAISNIISVFHNKKNKKTIRYLSESVDKVCNQINSNKKISFNDYDYYTLLIKQRFSEYIDQIDKSIYLEIKPTMYEHTYIECTNRLDLMNLEIDRIKNIFSEVEKTLLDEEISKFKNKIEPHVYETITSIWTLANNYILDNLQSQINTHIKPIFLAHNIEIIIMTEKFTSDLSKAIDNIGVCFEQNYGCSLHKKAIDQMKKYLLERLDYCKSDLIHKINLQNKIHNDLYKKAIETLKNVTTLEYVKNQIHTFNNFSHDHIVRFDWLDNKLKQDILEIFAGKIMQLGITDIMYLHNYTKLELKYKWFSTDLPKFVELEKHINETISIGLFQNKRIVLEKMYLNHLLSCYKSNHIDINIIDRQSLLNDITMLKINVGPHTNANSDTNISDIFTKITNIECNVFNELLCYNQTDSNVEIFLKKLTDFVGLKYEFIEKFSKTALHDKKNYDGKNRNIKILTLDLTHNFFGKAFLQKLINKYIEVEYST